MVSMPDGITMPHRITMCCTSHKSATVPCDASNSLISVPVFDLPIRFDVMKPGERWTYRSREVGWAVGHAMPC